MGCKGGLFGGETDEKRKMHVIAWEMIARPKQPGGVSLRDLNVMNQVCLMKLGWQMYKFFNELWCNMLRQKIQGAQLW